VTTHHVAYAVDEDYWLPLYVSIQSLLANNRDLSLHVHVLHADRDETFFENLPRLDAVHDDAIVESVSVDGGALATAPTPHWFTRANVYRFLLPEVLPENRSTGPSTWTAIPSSTVRWPHSSTWTSATAWPRRPPSTNFARSNSAFPSRTCTTTPA